MAIPPSQRAWANMYDGELLEPVTFGEITFHNPVAIAEDIVQCYLVHGELIQNGSKPFMMSRRAWDALVAASKERGQARRDAETCTCGHRKADHFAPGAECVRLHCDCVAFAQTEAT